MNAPQLFGALLVGHALADYPLQGDFLAHAKNRTAPIAGVPWYQALGAHVLIHGGMVAGILALFGHSELWWLGVCEAVMHAAIDDGKCAGRYGFNADQVMHVACKALWVMLAGVVTTLAGLAA
jgi:hypothetical protein